MEMISPLVFDRYELKYLIPVELVGPISQFISPYCELDHYSKISEDGFYQVNSLYLDTPNFLFYHRKLSGEDNRFNMRIRSYGGEDFFMELKFKSKGFVKKRRALCSGNVLEALHLDEDEGFGVVGKNNKILFINALQSYNAEPKVLTQYRRKAYFSNYDDYARITFDRDLRFMQENDFNLTPNPDLMCNYDNELQFDEGTNVILELKCPQSVPLWFIDIIKRFDLTRSGFSKYASSISEVIPQFHANRHDRVLAF